MWVADSPGGRLFIELCSYGSDLAEAGAAIDLAIRASEEHGPLRDAQLGLVGFAAVAYCRTFMPSKVRQPMTAHVGIPSDLMAVHKMVRSFRNATVAHSQSELATTHPVALLDPRGRRLLYVAAHTVISTLPWAALHQFRALIAAVDERSDEAIDSVRQRLEASLRDRPFEEISSTLGPVTLDKFAEEFEPSSTRPPYPAAQTFYWANA